MIKVLVKEVGKRGEVRQIPDNCEAFRQITGGFFSGHCLMSFIPAVELSNVMLLCNDTGKLDGLPFNCWIGGVEWLVGGVLFTAYDSHGNSIDLTERQITLIQHSLTER